MIYVNKKTKAQIVTDSIIVAPNWEEAKSTKTDTKEYTK